MSSTALTAPDAHALEKVLLQGDLSSLTPAQRITYYRELCASLDLNPLTKPFEYLELKGPGGKVSLTLYTKKDCTDQLRNKRDVSCKIISRETVEGVYIVTARASTPGGREEESIGAVPIQKEGGRWHNKDGRNQFEPDGTYVPLSPTERANAMMKAETKAKRRATLSLFGLGFTDETEVEQIRGATTVTVEQAQAQIEAPVGPSRKVPEELMVVVDKLRKGDFSAVKSACAFLEACCAEEGIPLACTNRQAGLRTSFPKGNVIPADVMESFLLDVWGEIEEARLRRAFQSVAEAPSAESEPAKEGEYVATADDIPF